MILEHIMQKLACVFLFYLLTLSTKSVITFLGTGGVNVALYPQGGKGDMEEMMPAPASAATSPTLSAISRNILRKARLNLNKSTLQKIRNPASLQRLIPESNEGMVS